MSLPVTVVRRDGWDIRLRELVDAARQRPFEYGVHDCSTFATLEVPRALSGEDYRGRIGAEWKNEAEAMALLEDKSLETLVSNAFGAAIDGWKFARRGDIGLFHASAVPGNLPVLGVVIGAMVACPAPIGLTFLRADRLEKVWRLG